MSVTLAAIAIGGAGCSNDNADENSSAAAGRPAPFKTRVDIRDSRYHPANVKVLVGGSVTFVNRDETLPHTAQTAQSTSDEPWDDEFFFDTHTLTWNEPYTVTLHKPGTLAFFCSFDETMRGTVEVLARAPSS